MQVQRFGVFAMVWCAGAFAAGCGSQGSRTLGGAAAGATAAVAGGVSAAGAGGVSAGGVGGMSAAGTGLNAQGGLDLVVVPEARAGSSNASGGATSIYPTTLPPGFTAADAFGGFKLGDPIPVSFGEAGAGGNPAAGGTGGSTDSCGTTILAVIRDFHADRKNFEGATGDDRMLVQSQLGADRKPVFAPAGPTLTVQDPAQFADWYRNVDGLNKAYKLEIWFGPNQGVSSFQSTAFFPIDGAGFGNEGNAHNYHFTTEIHTQFKYGGGEKFSFTGDDDVWVFINGKLAIDLGGVHQAEDASVDIDASAKELGLVLGQVYPFDMFQNERHTSESNFRADTTLNFVDCGTIIPEVPK